MNTITARPFKSRYVDEPHLTIWIDGEPLDQFLEARVSGKNLDGLVPAWLEWMLDEKDQKVAQSRMLLPPEGKVRVPILMCPDDLDFSCSLVIADLEAVGDEVKWNRLGYDQTKSLVPDAIGTEVVWFDGVSPLRFKRAEYENCIQAFQHENQKA